MPQFDLNIVESEVITLITLIHETDNKTEWKIVTLQQVSNFSAISLCEQITIQQNEDDDDVVCFVLK